ncbi:MAG: hypothetical protein DMG92_17225, partial [Acidobacteria bacterium]
AERGNFYIANLGLFPITPGSSSLYKLLPNHKLMKMFDGLTAVISLVFVDGKLYALETSTEADFPLPGSGKIVRVSDSGEITDVLTGLTFPTELMLMHCPPATRRAVNQQRRGWALGI